MYWLRYAVILMGGLTGLMPGGLRAAAPDPSTVYAWYAGDSNLVTGPDQYSVTRWVNLGTAATNATYTQAGRNLVNLTGAPQKLYLNAADGSALGAVTFGGSDGIWAAKSAWGMVTNNRTIIVCARIHNAVPEGFLFDSTSFSPGLTRALVWTNNWLVSVANNAGTVTAPVMTNAWQVDSFVITTNGGTPLIGQFINGAPAGSVSVAAPNYLSGLMIGANVSQAGGIQADVAELLVFNSALDGATRTNVENYLAGKWFGAAAATNAPPPPTPYVATQLFVSGQGYPEYRIPAMVTTTNGTIIAVADGRQGNGDIPNPIDCVCRRSFDNGNTWGPLQVIANYGSDTNDPANVDTYPAYGLTNIARTAAGDSSLLLDRTNGRVWVLYDNGAPAAGQFAGRAIKLELRYSDDNGATWSSRMDVEANNPALRPAITSAPEFLTGPGNGIQLATGTNAGRLIFPIYVYGSGSQDYSGLIYSDDHGVTWQRGGIAGNGGGEVQMVETTDGGVLASMRDNAFAWSGVRTFNRSADGGLTWGVLFTNTVNPPALPDPECQGSILRLTTANDSTASRIVFANCDSSTSRAAMTLRLSYDEGRSWPVSNLVYSGVSGYSALAKIANGEVGLLNEVNNYARIDFVARPVSVISGGSDTNWLGPSSLLNVAVAPATGNQPPSLDFSAVSNNSYTVQCCTNLRAGGWQSFAEIAAQTTNGTVQLPVDLVGGAQYFRVVTPGLP